ncbi:MAG: hypothetical protein RLZZ628_1774 [Bacteroidota bacterium]|jgi:hypothetical protein
MEENEKDIFEQLFREQEVLVEESPSPQLWERLEKKLDARPRPKRRPPMLQLPVTILILIVLVLATLVVWIWTHQHELRLKGQKQWAAIEFIAGNWVCDTNKSHIVLNFEQKAKEPLFIGQRETFFEGEATGESTMLVLLKNHQLQLVVSEKNKGKEKNAYPKTAIFNIQTYDSNHFIFKNKDDFEIAVLEKINNQHFSLKIGVGSPFVFKR